MHDEIVLNLKDVLYVLKKRRKLIGIITLASMFISGILSFYIIKPTYEAGTTIIVGKPQSAEKNNTQYNDVIMYQNLVKTYAQIATSTSVAERASEKLGGKLKSEELEKIVKVTPEQGTQILEIKATSKDPQDAVNIVNAVASSFVDESKSVFPTGGDIQVMDKAKLPKAPIKPKKLLDVVGALFVGLILSVGLAFVLEYMDSTIKTEEEISKYLEMPVIGIIPKLDKTM